MSEASSKTHITATNSQVAIGDHNVQQQSVATGGLSIPERREIDELLARFHARVATQAPPEQQQPALERVQELTDQLAGDAPDLSTLEYVRNWFGRNVPNLAGAVTSLVVNPLIGKLVAAAGDGLAAEWRRRFGVE